MSEENPSYNILPELGGEKLVVSDSGKVNWNLALTGLAFADTSIIDFTNKHRHYDMKFEWMDLDEFMRIQHQIYEKYARKNAKYHTGTGPIRSFDDYWETTVSQKNVDNILELMKDGGLFNSFVIEIYKDDKLCNFQEGRHRAVALKSLGIKKVPVWIAKHRFKNERDDE
jgi:hypothetical protein